MPLDEPIVPESPAAGPTPLRGAADDARPHMPVPPPVRLVAIRDVEMPAVAGLETQLDALYVGVLGFERDPAEPHAPVYHAYRNAIRFHVVEVPQPRDDCRPLGIMTPQYAEVIEALRERKIEFEEVRGLVAGTDGILLQDPAGNWLAVARLAEVR